MSIGKNKNSFAIFGLLFGAITWGIIWYPYRLLAQAGFSGVASSFITYAIAALIGVVIFMRHWRQVSSLPKSIIWLMLAAGWTNLSYVLAVIEGEVMRVMLLFYLSPVWTLLLAHFWLKERVGVKGIVVILTSLLGAFIMLYDASHESHLPLPHNAPEWLALTAGMGFALSNVITRKSHHLTLHAKSFAVWLGVVLVSLMSLPFLEQRFLVSDMMGVAGWGVVLLISVMLFAATLFVQYGVTHMAAVPASIIFLFELVVAAIAAYYLANEVMVLNEWVGGILIASAALFAASNATD